MEEKEKVLITKSQYSALNQMRGLHQDAHYMVILAKEYKNGFVLEGTEAAFDHLLRDIHDEVYYELQPATRIKHLRSLICRLEPDGDF